MTEDIENAMPAFPTRRALREAERREAARGGRRRQSASPQRPKVPAAQPRVVHSGPATTDRSATARPSSTPAAAPRPGSVPTAAPRPSSGPGNSRPPSAKNARDGRRPSRLLTRGAVLASLAIATTGIPLSGTALPNSTPSPSAFVASSALDVLSAEQVDGTDVFDSSASFAADPLAAARALLTTGRDEGRDVLQCGSSELEANGQVAAGATTEPVEVMMPLTTGSYHITSRYGYRWGGMHEGLDMAAPSGTPIHAVSAGEVTYVGYGLGGRSGMIIVLKHDIDGEIYWTWYIHMYPDGIFVDVGDKVGAGDVIGEVGSYGNSTGPHLHLEVHVDDEYTTVDPATWLEAHDAAPLTAENLACAAE